MEHLTQSDNCVQQVRRAGKEFLRFEFNGILTPKKAQELCAQWEKYFVDQPDKTFVIVFNATNMDDYDPQARILFQKYLKGLSKQIDKIWVVTESKIILGGASIMSLIVGLPIKAVRSEEQISF
ncbi:MAG: hypothetical protein O9262_06715 [Cyclobacteriaceae bacterium]|nr:hypothetical protein [Cyclobacteriaceae bacterium]